MIGTVVALVTLVLPMHAFADDVPDADPSAPSAPSATAEPTQTSEVPADAGATETPEISPGDESPTSEASPSATEVAAPTEAAEPTEGPVPDETPATTETPAGEGGRAPAADDEATLNVTLTQQTGTGPFDADDTPGHDSSADNDVVRTNDTVTYNVGVRFEGADQTNPTITFTLPKGEELVSLPPFCKAGSSVTPATLPDPVVPVTLTSWETLPAQTVVCVVDDQAQGTALDYAFVSKVRPEVPDGTTLDPVTVSATSDQVTDPSTSEPVEHVVSAIAQFDVSKRLTAGNPNSGPLYQESKPCTFDTSRNCTRVYYPITITAPQSGKGVAPLASPITLSDDLTPASFFGAAAWAAAVAATGSEAAAIEKYAPRLVGCSNVSGVMGNSMPGSTGGGAYSVRDSGTTTCTQPGGAGNKVDITITGADTTAYTVPTNAANGNTVPATTAYVYSKIIQIEIPQDATLEVGETDGGVSNLSTHNVLDDMVMADIAGHDNIGEKPANNVRDVTINLRNSGSFDKFFAGIFGTPGNQSAYEYAGVGSWEGPPGSSKVHDGNTVVLDKQLVQSDLVFSEAGVPGDAGSSNTLVGCDVWPASQLTLATRGAAPITVDRFIYGGSQHPQSDAGTPGSVVQNLRIEYSSGAAGPGAASDCSGGTWYDDPTAVPGSATSTDTTGLKTWTGVNRVRISFTTDWSGSATDLSLSFAIGQQVEGVTDDIVPNYASYKRTPGVQDVDDALADDATDYQLSTYDPATNGGKQGDRLRVVTAIARIKKFVKNPTTGAFTDTAVPQYTAGSELQYRLNPTLTADVQSSGSFTPVTVEDCLPKYEEYVSSVHESGAAISPSVVQKGAPADAGITCPADQTYVRWDLGSLEVGKTIDPVVVTVEVVETVRNGTYTNNTLVSSPGDPSPASLRDDDVQVQIVTPTGIKIAKTVDQQLIEVNPDGVTHPRKLTWTVTFANIDAPANVANVDVVDVLPADGLAGSAFQGTSVFESATPAGGSGITVLYSGRTPADLSVDPEDASNTAAGSTVWCDAPAGGAVVSGVGTAADCPTAAADVTALRFLRAGAFTPDDLFSVKVVTVPVGNAGGDIYRNRTSGRADGVSQQVGPAARTATVIDSSVGDLVWDDLDHDGVQDAGEPGIAGWPVTLTGTDVDGNAVSLTTTTDGSGHYLFDGLASGDYELDFSRSPMPVNSGWTLQDVGDDASDSDVDPATGRTATFALGRDQDDLTRDAGVFVDRDVDITVDKSLVSATEPDEDNNTTVTYDVTVTNSGTAQGTYDLDDRVRFGDGIEVSSVEATNTDPGSITVDPAFDGVDHPRIVTGEVLPGGATHVYRVVVEAQVTTTSTSSTRDCTLTETETGTGYLNSATVTVDGVTSTDEACGTPGTPRQPDISVDKRVLSASKLDGQHRSTVTYALTVRNTGDTFGTYSLDDELQFGGHIEVLDVGVENTRPGDITVNPGFDGQGDQVIVSDQRLEAGATHRYQVTVTAEVSTEIATTEQDCALATDETGTGYLNEARLVVDGSTTTDTACIAVPTPPGPTNPPTEPPGGGGGGLPNTGGPALWVGTVGVLATLLGVLLLARRRWEVEA